MSFPAYPEYKDSGVPWLGAVPRRWEVGQFKRLVEIQNGADYKHVEADEGYPVIGSGGAFTFASDYLYDGEAVLLGRKGTIDKPLHVTGRFWTVDTMYWAKIRPEVSGRFAFYAALTIPFSYYSTSTALPSMTQSALNAHMVALPSEEEQQAIAAFLDRETAKIDALVAEQERLIALLKEKRQAVISHAVTKGLNPDAPMKDSGIEWLGEIPVHWEVVKIVRLFRASKGKEGQLLTKEYCAEHAGEFPVYSGQTENAGVMGTLDRYEFDAGDQGYLFSTTVGAKAMTVSHIFGKFSLSQNCMIIRPSNPSVDPRFFYYHFQPVFGYHRSLIPDHMQPSFRMEDLYGFAVALPPKDEQVEIAGFLDRTLDGYEGLTNEAQAAITLLQERRAALISAAVTGKIDVRGLVDASSELEAA